LQLPDVGSIDELQNADVDVVAVVEIVHPAAEAPGTAAKFIFRTQFWLGIDPSAGQLAGPFLVQPVTSPGMVQQLEELHAMVLVAAGNNVLLASVRGVPSESIHTAPTVPSCPVVACCSITYCFF
jgi:hypothetical protein